MNDRHYLIDQLRRSGIEVNSTVKCPYGCLFEKNEVGSDDYSIEQHLHCHHLQHLPYYCADCQHGSRYYSEALVQIHCMRVHDDIRPDLVRRVHSANRLHDDYMEKMSKAMQSLMRLTGSSDLSSLQNCDLTSVVPYLKLTSKTQNVIQLVKREKADSSTDIKVNKLDYSSAVSSQDTSEMDHQAADMPFDACLEEYIGKLEDGLSPRKKLQCRLSQCGFSVDRSPQRSNRFSRVNVAQHVYHHFSATEQRSLFMCSVCGTDLKERPQSWFQHFKHKHPAAADGWKEKVLDLRSQYANELTGVMKRCFDRQ